MQPPVVKVRMKLATQTTRKLWNEGSNIATRLKTVIVV